MHSTRFIELNMKLQILIKFDSDFFHILMN